MLETGSSPRPTRAVALSFAAFVVGAELMLAVASLIGAIPRYVEICEASKYPYHYDCATYHATVAPLVQLGILVESHEGAIVAVGTLIIAFFTRTLWRSTREMREGADAMLAHLQESSRRELRAYVFPPQPKLIRIANRITFMLRNSGETPASEVKCWLHVYHGPANVPVAVTKPDVLPGLNSIIQRAEETETPVTIPDCDAVEEQLIAEGATRCIRLQGHLSYKDVFGITQTAEFGFVSEGNDINLGRMVPMADTHRAS